MSVRVYSIYHLIRMQSFASSAEEMSNATEELSSMAQELQRLVEQFQVKEEEEVPAPRRIARLSAYSIDAYGVVSTASTSA